LDATVAAPGEGVVRVPLDAAGDRDARFARSLEAQYPPLLRLAYVLARSRVEAEDALQTSLERAWRARRQLVDESRIEAWLRQIVVREVVRRQTSAWSRLVRPATPVDLSRLVARRTTELDVELLDALARLPVAQRVAIVLHWYAGFEVSEISRTLRVPEETIRSRLRVGMGTLRKDLPR
jgi:RNA polymerase sigma-70 factor (ECF subfamily)